MQLLVFQTIDYITKLDLARIAATFSEFAVLSSAMVSLSAVITLIINLRLNYDSNFGRKQFFYATHKPASLSVHNQLPSVYEYIKTHKLPEHFVNRLDRETSGLMLISQKTEYHPPSV